MNDPVAQGARAAAQRLASTGGEDLAHGVEVALHSRGSDRGPGQYADPAEIGSLVVSVATFAWTVYTDLRRRGATPTGDSVGPRVRQELQRAETPVPPLDTASRDRVVDVTVEETLRAAREQEQGGHEHGHEQGLEQGRGHEQDPAAQP